MVVVIICKRELCQRALNSFFCFVFVFLHSVETINRLNEVATGWLCWFPVGQRRSSRMAGGVAAGNACDSASGIRVQ